MEPRSGALPAAEAHHQCAVPAPPLAVIPPSSSFATEPFKPTRGAIGTRGGMALAEELDHIGVLTRDTDDVALACRVLFGRDAEDPGSRAVPPPDVAASPRPGHALLVVGPLRARVAAASEQAVRRAAEALGRAGVTVTRIELPADFDRIEWITYTLL